jgi:hypothetical protein
MAAIASGVGAAEKPLLDKAWLTFGFAIYAVFTPGSVGMKAFTAGPPVSTPSHRNSKPTG